MQDSLKTDSIVHGQADDEISLLDIAIALGEEKKTVLTVFAFTTIAALVVSFLITPIFTARTVVLPPQQQQSSASAALASLGALAGVAGAAAGIKSSDEMYISFLKSDTISNTLIKRFGLMERYEAKTMTDARKALESNVRVSGDKKSGLITIEADDKDPKFAPQLANAYIDALHDLMGKLAVTDAQQRRVFLEQQLNLTKDRLAKAEVDLRNLQAKEGVISIDAQAQGAIRATVDLRAQIAQREVALGALRTYATSENADVKRLAAELAGLRGQLSRLETGTGQSTEDNKGLQTVRAYREVKYQEAVMDALVRQFELAKVDEARDGPLLQQVDVATVPERKSKPKRALIVLMGAFGGLFVGIVLALIRRAVRQATSDREGSERFIALKAAWSLKR